MSIKVRSKTLLLSLCLVFSWIAVPALGDLDEVRVESLDTAPRARLGLALADRSGVDLSSRVQEALDAARAGIIDLPDTTPKLAHRLGRDAEVVWRPGVGTPAQIKGPSLQFRVKKAEPETDVRLATARAFLRANRQLLKLQDPDRELELRSTETDELGLSHLRFDQEYRGLEVWPADLIVHLDENDDVYLLDGAFVPTPRLPTTTPVVPEEQARAAALEEVADLPADYSVESSELVVSVLNTRRPALAWKSTLKGDDSTGWLVVTDAISGSVLARIPTHLNVSGSGVDVLGTTRPLEVVFQEGLYYLVDTSKPMYNPATGDGVIATTDLFGFPRPPFSPALVSSPSRTAWSPPEAVSAHYLLSETYDYFRTVHGRDSINGNGGEFYAVVRNGVCGNNAFWPNGSKGDGPITFCSGTPFAGAPDIVAHEFTHGVIEFSTNLVYKGQPGAMNEAWADILGTMVERRIQGGVDWLLGDEIAIARDMETPEAFDQPSRMSDYQNLPPEIDNGGVHINSGIINHAFYQLVDGLPGAIGADKAEKIFYRALVHHLSRNSQFTDARLACIQAAEELYGAGSPEARKVGQAFDKVEIFGSVPTPAPPPNPTVFGEDSTAFVYWDAESGEWVLGRRESAFGDPALGVGLVTRVANTRPSLSGDGSLAFFVAANADACFVATDGSGLECLGIPGSVYSVAMSPDANFFAFVLRDQEGEPEDVIRLVDFSAGTEETIELVAPGLDGPSLDTVVLADAMDFTADGSILYYDALNVVEFEDGTQLGAWSIYARDLVSDLTFSLVPAVPGLQIGFPAVANTTDYRLTFEAFDEASGVTGVYSADLINGELGFVDAVETTFAAPSYLGDDSGLVYTVLDEAVPTGTSLVETDLADDGINPAGGRKPWLDDAGFGVIYRRGEFTGPPDAITSSIYPDYRFWVWIISQNGQVRIGAHETECIPETVCVSGAIPGRSEVFIRLVGPKPNGMIWPTLVKFSTSRVEIRIEQISSGQLRHYVFEGASPGSSDLTGAFDRFGFFPTNQAAADTFLKPKPATMRSSGGPTASLTGFSTLETRVLEPNASGPPPPSGDWISSSRLPGFRAKVRITAGSNSILGSGEPACIDETLCVSGAIPGRSEIFLRVVGPKPNGYLWPTIVKFSTSQIEIWLEQTSTGQVNYYLLEGARPGSSELEGLFDRQGFLP